MFVVKDRQVAGCHLLQFIYAFLCKYPAVRTFGQIGLIVTVHVTQRFLGAGFMGVQMELEGNISGIGKTVVMKCVEYLP